MILPANMGLDQLVLDEIGLEFYNGVLIDQDTRNTILYNEKTIIPKLQGHARSSQVYAEFDPKNPKFMNFLFSYFTNKILKEQNIYIETVYYIPIKGSYRCPLAIKANGSEYHSRVYNLESLKYLDLICQLNGGVDVNLDIFDIEDT